jgi:DNA/RNA endonuclease YhcR with UshA esterase domain
MRTLFLALVAAFGLAFAAAAIAQTPGQTSAQTVTPADAHSHVDQTVTVEGAVSNVHKIPSGITFIDMGGKYPDNTFTAVILAADTAKFPDMTSLNGKTVDVTGKVQLYKGKPEILLTDTSQIKAK